MSPPHSLVVVMSIHPLRLSQFPIQIATSKRGTYQEQIGQHYNHVDLQRFWVMLTSLIFCKPN